IAADRLPVLLQALPAQRALVELSQEIWQTGRSSRSMFLMGAAVVVATLRGERLEVAHAGDCRAYLLTDGHLTRLTRDHVYREQLDTRGDGRLVRHLGLKELEPDVLEVDFPPGGRLLLCSDGLHKEIPEDEVARLLGTPEGAKQACDLLVDAAREAGGHDNITALVVLSPVDNISEHG
ncbi:MAG: SpoIIE family protein phosphatase, partial [Candidatus Eremiobacterota bacterium]